MGVVRGGAVEASRDCRHPLYKAVDEALPFLGRLDAADRADFERNRAAVRAEFDEPAFTGAWAEG